MALQNCCGCCSLKTGVLIIAILTLIHTALSMIAMMAHVIMPAQNITVTDGTTELHIQQSSNIYEYLIGPAIIQFVIALCFIYGVAKEKRYFILPTLIVKMIEIVVLIIYVVFVAVVVHPAFLLFFALVALAFYIWYVIFSYYKHLSERDATTYSTVEMNKNNFMRKV